MGLSCDRDHEWAGMGGMTRRLVFSIAFGLALTACSDAAGPLDDLVVARQRWVRERPAAYRYTLTRSCFCGFVGPVEIEVRGDSVVARRSPNGEPPVGPQVASSFPSVDGLFRIVGDAIDRKAASLDAAYDPRLGYPSRISIDYDRQIADDEIVYTVSAFQRL